MKTINIFADARIFSGFDRQFWSIGVELLREGHHGYDEYHHARGEQYLLPAVVVALDELEV